MNDIMRTLRLRFPGCVLAGGAVRDIHIGVEPQDYDLFFLLNRDYRAARGLANAIMQQTKERNNSGLYYCSELGINIDFIDASRYNSIEEIVNSFDFTVCCVALDNNDQLIKHPYFEEHATKRELHFNKITAPFSCVDRAIRFAGRGWSVPKETTGQLVGALRNMTPEQKEADQLYGLEADSVEPPVPVNDILDTILDDILDDIFK